MTAQWKTTIHVRPGSSLNEMNVLVLIPVSSPIHVALDPKKPMAGFIKLGKSFALEYTAGGKPACSQ